MRALLRARETGYRLGRQSVARLRTAVEAAAAEIEAHGSTSTLTRARADAIRKELRAVLFELENAASTETARASALTAQEIVDLHKRVLAQIADAEGVSAQAVVARLSGANLRALATLQARRVRAASFRTLVRRHLESAAPELDAMVDRAIVQGMSTSKLARDVADLLRGQDVRVDEYGLTRSDVTDLRTVEYDARRIAVSEINNAMREANLHAMRESGIVEAATWQVSGRHAALPSSPDACDDLAEDDSYNGEPGAYALDAWPLAPHPFCGCTQGGPVYFRPVDQWPGADAEADE